MKLFEFFVVYIDTEHFTTGVITLKKIFLIVWTAICAVWATTACTMLVFAEEPAGRAAKVMLTMDVLQTVCLIIVIAAAILVLAFYVVKLVLKKLHVAPEDKDQEKK